MTKPNFFISSLNYFFSCISQCTLCIFFILFNKFEMQVSLYNLSCQIYQLTFGWLWIVLSCINCSSKVCCTMLLEKVSIKRNDCDQTTKKLCMHRRSRACTKSTAVNLLYYHSSWSCVRSLLLYL